MFTLSDSTSSPSSFLRWCLKGIWEVDSDGGRGAPTYWLWAETPISTCVCIFTLVPPMTKCAGDVRSPTWRRAPTASKGWPYYVWLPPPTYSVTLRASLRHLYPVRKLPKLEILYFHMSNKKICQEACEKLFMHRFSFVE